MAHKQQDELEAKGRAINDVVWFDHDTVWLNNFQKPNKEEKW